MSANFIIEYAGVPCRFGFEQRHTVELVPEWQADRFASEADAWWAAYQAGLNPDRCRVVNLHLNTATPHPGPLPIRSADSANAERGNLSRAFEKSKS